MIKALFRYLPVLAVLLISGYSQSYARAYESAFNSPSGSYSKRALADPTLQEESKERECVYAPLDSERKKQTDLTEVAEVKVEEDEVHFSKKYLSANNFYTISFDAQSAVYFFHLLKHRTSQRKQLSYHATPASRTVTFGVFRI